MYFPTWRSSWVLLALIATAMATTAYFIKGIAANLKLMRRDVLPSAAWEEGWNWDWTVYATWVARSQALSLLAVLWTHLISPAAAGSGIAEIRTILSGVALDTCTSVRTLVSKVCGLTIGVGSGLPIGLEGPFVHIAAAIATQMCRLPCFLQIANTEESKRSIVAAACAVGVGCCLGSVFGGIIYSMETTSSNYDLASYWQALYCATWGSVVLRIWENTELLPTAGPYTSTWNPVGLDELPIHFIIGAIGGLLGALFVYLNESHISTRVRLGWHTTQWYSHILWPLVVTFVTSTLTFPPLLGGIFPSESAAVGDLVTLEDLGTKKVHFPQRDTVGHLFLYFISMFLSTLATLSLPVPCGVYVPCLNIGAGYGRLCGEILQQIGWPSSELRLYAIVGAAGFTVGVTRTISTVIILIQLTEQFQYTQPILVSVLGAYILSNVLYPSVYDSIARLKKLPYLPSLIAFNPINLTAQDIMKDPLYITPMTTYKDLLTVLPLAQDHSLYAVPYVEDPINMKLGGAVPVAALQAIKATADFHAAGSHTPWLPSKYLVLITRLDEQQHWLISVSLRDFAKSEDALLLAEARLKQQMSFCPKADAYFTDDYVEVEPLTPCSGYEVCQASPASLGGASRSAARHAVRRSRMDIPAAVLANATINFSPHIIEVPRQVTSEDTFLTLHRIFMNLSLREACVCHFGTLVGLIPRSTIVEVLTNHSSAGGPLFKGAS